MRHAETPRQCLAHLHSLNRDNPPLSTPAAEAQDITTPPASSTTGSSQSMLFGARARRRQKGVHLRTAHRRRRSLVAGRGAGLAVRPRGRLRAGALSGRGRGAELGDHVEGLGGAVEHVGGVLLLAVQRAVDVLVRGVGQDEELHDHAAVLGADPVGARLRLLDDAGYPVELGEDDEAGRRERDALGASGDRKQSHAAGFVLLELLHILLALRERCAAVDADMVQALFR
mmetsp:Transcript_89355/g.255923  ORF Transcript_89355/g.255923 Transcript_89355/m.255923 type:complete len:229 (-) Transcript_89355:1721-2407(-)